MFDKLFEKMGDKVGGGNNQKRKRFFLFLLLVFFGIGAMLVSSFFQPEEDAMPPGNERGLLTSKNSAQPAQAKMSEGTIMQKYEAEYEQELANILSKVVGVSDVDVVVNLDSTEEEVIQNETQQNVQTTTETDPKGGTRSTQQNNTNNKTAMYRDGSGEKPLVVKRLKPRVRGVLVVARGVEDLQVKAIVLQAIQRVLDLPIHRIEVLSKG
ncbi:stage III sporulation protein AG [Thermoactinomyces sp. DSM 45892]|uniref:stage III sporulation protein AG n=1 Tax=Thermoactinomyces sp. DSM 45892 TaxID=1882753 RepID=UPI00089A335A|nr:stage III sporulation protein AG [Thermoactinomyces sp. DSM 45892]SDX99630.1 stage III sporulation protein AG [Thermoactinomyces sp. DSM 45892]